MKTWLDVAAEWQRAWSREETADKLSGIIIQHGGGSGIVLLQEQQLVMPVSNAA
ncbi:hypothetical protein [uncultured Jannaschia sp.]|uniref:hypothetical protein n=1 Tax=uncultured Jannaschia sp. TaxID=293347 RepID=UPI002623F75F|nr:hypothetical protein [uncultured Jannaschia sp.]